MHRTPPWVNIEFPNLSFDYCSACVVPEYAMDSCEFNVRSGVRQSCVLSQFFLSMGNFIAFMGRDWQIVSKLGWNFRPMASWYTRHNLRVVG